MSVSQIIVLCLSLGGFLFVGIWALTFGRKYRWPDGERLERTTKSGIKIYIINAPGGTDHDKSIVADACCNAIFSCFKVWDEYQLKVSQPAAEEDIEKFCVYFVDDMDERHRKMWPNSKYKTLNAYLAFVSRAFGSSIPMAVVRDTLSPLVIKAGKPVIHEAIHALLGEYSQVGFDRAHTHKAWKTVRPDAESYYIMTYTKKA